LSSNRGYWKIRCQTLGIGFFLSVQQHLIDPGDAFNCSDLGAMTQNIPVEWVACALDLSSQAIISRRRLSADQVL